MGHGVGQYGRRQPGVSHHPVGDGAGRPQGAGAFGGKHYRNRLAAPADVAVAAQVIGGIAGQHGAHGDNIFPQGAQPGRAQPQVEDGGVAGADAQKGPPAGQFLQRCDGRGHHRRVPGQRVGNGGAQMHALRFQRRHRQGYEQLPEQGLRIGHADVVKADGLGQADVLAEGIVGCGEQGYAVFQGCDCLRGRASSGQIDRASQVADWGPGIAMPLALWRRLTPVRRRMRKCGRFHR